MTKSQVYELIERLGGPEGCNFHEEKPGDVKSATWKCAGGHDQSLCIAIMNKMGISQDDQIDIRKVFTALGGHCDCEILFNAEQRIVDFLQDVYDGADCLTVLKEKAKEDLRLIYADKPQRGQEVIDRIGL